MAKRYKIQIYDVVKEIETDDFNSVMKEWEHHKGYSMKIYPSGRVVIIPNGIQEGCDIISFIQFLKERMDDFGEVAKEILELSKKFSEALSKLEELFLETDFDIGDEDESNQDDE